MKRAVLVLVLAAAGLIPAGTVLAQSDFAAPDFAGPEIRAQLTPVHFTTLSSEIAARIEHIATLTGDRFAKGDVLIEFDCATQKAQLAEAAAEENQSRKALVVTQRLVALKSIGQIDVDAAEAAVQKAEAQRAVAEASVGKCRIVAPYGGVAVDRKAQEYQYVTPGTPILEVVDDLDLEVELIAPSRWLAWLTPGFAFEIHVDELDRTFAAHVTRLGGQVDPVSQSVKVIGQIDGASVGLMPGMSGSIRITPPATEGNSGS